MLVEMSSPVFKAYGKTRPAIHFRQGLNVILGTEDGANSIGKSSALLAIDFAFGGTAYLESDGVKKKGHHAIYFTFLFSDVRYSFVRSTEDPEIVHVCNKDQALTGIGWDRAKFCDWLKKQYQIDYPGLSFRSTLSSFFRIYGKENFTEKKPLYGVPGDTMQKSIDRVVKLFDRYRDIEAFTVKLDEQKKKLAAYREARKYRFVSDLVGGKTQFEVNVHEINALRQELGRIGEEESEERSEENIQKSQERNRLKRALLDLESKSVDKQRRLKLLDMSMDYGLYPNESDLSELQRYFPDVNLRRLYEVEHYHRKLAKIMDDQFEEERTQVRIDMESLEAQVLQVKEQIHELGQVGHFSKEFLDRYADLTAKLNALQLQNEAYLLLLDLQAEKKKADQILKRAIRTILTEIEHAINTRMKAMNDALFIGERRKAPHLQFNEYDSYRFETPDDTGTGSNYKGLVLYDLTVLSLTGLPALAHDSMILKNIGDGAIDGIMKIYAQSPKQIFVAFDKHLSYTSDTEKILLEHTVIRLYPRDGALYGETWNEEA